MQEFTPKPLPPLAEQLCSKLQAPSRLIAHLRLVHDAACVIVQVLGERYPQLPFDHDSVLHGAAIHDLGKCIHPAELYGPGRQHEVDGPAFLEKHGVSASLARHCRTHGAWDREDLSIEELLVCLADAAWKGQRQENLECKLVNRIAEHCDLESWEVFAEFDNLLQVVTEQAEQRLVWQATYG